MEPEAAPMVFFKQILVKITNFLKPDVAADRASFGCYSESTAGKKLSPNNSSSLIVPFEPM
jgi:hypothetical protein